MTTEPPYIPPEKLDEYRYFAVKDDDLTSIEKFPFEVPERDVMVELHDKNTMLCEWMRDNLSYPWTVVMRPEECKSLYDVNEDPIDELFFRFQTEQDAMLFKLRF